MSNLKFTGQDGFYPEWARGKCRWILQKPPIRGLKSDHFPPEAEQLLVWAPALKNIFGKRTIRLENGNTSNISLQEEISRSIKELNLIPFKCKCGWKGSGKKLGYAGELTYYALSCPKCENDCFMSSRSNSEYSGDVPRGLEPDLRKIDKDLILAQWNKLGKPPLENRGATADIVWVDSSVPFAERCVNTVGDLEWWIGYFKPTPTELAYVGQQLFYDFAEFMWRCSRK